MNRLEGLATHLVQEKISGKNPDDVVICSAVRTPLTKAKRGGLKNTPTEFMLSIALKAAYERAKLDPTKIQDVVVGNNLQSGAGEIPSRMA